MKRRVIKSVIIGSVAIRHGVLLTPLQLAKFYRPRYRAQKPLAPDFDDTLRTDNIRREVAELKMMVSTESNSAESQMDTRVAWADGMDSNTITDELTEYFAEGRKLSEPAYLEFIKTIGEVKGCSVSHQGRHCQTADMLTRPSSGEPHLCRQRNVSILRRTSIPPTSRLDGSNHSSQVRQTPCTSPNHRSCSVVVVQGPTPFSSSEHSSLDNVEILSTYSHERSLHTEHVPRHQR
jgi:hypothetical protein